MADIVTNTTLWGLRPLESFVAKELERRAQEYGSNPTNDDGKNLGSGATVDTATKNYSGPRTAWTRVCSNGKVDYGNGTVKNGFILGGVNGFNDTYGFGRSSITEKLNSTTLGYTAYGEPHELKNDDGSVFPHRPSPGVIGVETEFFGAGSGFNGLCRKATIKWRCNSVDQLEYMFPYFLSPGVSVVIEWGWNNFNPVSLIDLTKKGEPASEGNPGSGLIGMFTNSDLIYDLIKKSDGNYDCHIGKIFDYSVAINSAGGFDCTTVVANSLHLVEGISLNINTVKNNKEKTPMKQFVDFINRDISDFAKNGDHYIIDKNDESHQGDYWIPMSRFQNIINNYLSFSLPGRGINDKVSGIMKFDVSGAIISAHPLLKSVNPDVLFPNPFAPVLQPSSKIIKEVFAAGQGDSILKQNPRTIGQAYTNTEFDIFRTKFDELGLEFTYDDLNVIINKNRKDGENHSFPQFKPLDKNKSGYYGYLKDIFISTKLIKEAVAANDTALGLIEYILGVISSAGSNIWEFRVRPKSPEDNGTYGVMDNNYNSLESDKVPIFKIGSTKSAHFTDLSLDIKMSEVMANQAILGQNKYTFRSGTNTNANISNNDVKVSMFTSDDRLFASAFVDSPDKETVNDKLRTVLERFNNYGLSVKTNGISHILVEQDTALMTRLLHTGDQASYLASPIMPGTEMSVSCPGLGGFRFLDMIAFDKLPTPYSYKRAVWQVEGVKNNIENNIWTTTISMRVRPRTVIL